MKVGILFSGGKDSCLALHKAIEKHGKENCVLLVMMPESFDSFMFHQPIENLLREQIKMLGIRAIIEKTRGEKDEELEDLKSLLKKAKKEGVEEIVAGGLASNYQGERIKKICEELNLRLWLPLWSYDAEKLWKELFDLGFKVILTKISCEGMGKDYLGKILNKEDFEKLKTLSRIHKFRLDFEGGEAESAVLYMPEFSKEIKMQNVSIKSEGKYRHFINSLEMR